MIVKKVLVADDEPIIRKVLEREFKDNGFHVDIACDGVEAEMKIRTLNYDVVVMDVRMPKKDGLSVLKQIDFAIKNTIIIMMTAYGTIDNAVEAMKIGAFDYITKPFDITDLLAKISQAIEVNRKISGLKVEEEKEVHIVGKSKELLRLKENIDKVKNLNATLLITGESGTGKGIVAKSIHASGNRSMYPFIHVNCAALPSNLIESELFGHKKGAFTGAVEDKKGKFEVAGKGTIFLDEISSMPLDLQSKLLIVLEERKVEKVGGNKLIPVEARFIAATNENLEEAVKQNRFREDLFYRLNVISIECPPLRYRTDDIEPLTTFFVQKFNKKFKKGINSVSQPVWEILRKYNWPGNIRELENAIESAVALTNDDQLKVEDLPLRIVNKIDKLNEDGYGNLKLQEMRAIEKALIKHKGHREKTAQELGISRRALQYKIKLYSLRDRY